MSALKGIRIGALIVAMIAPVLPGPLASGERPRECYSVELVDAEMATRYGQYRFGDGIAADKHLILMVSPTTREWSLLYAYANGQVCVVEHGDRWNWPGSTMGESS